jgi:hypothetical protein
MLRSIFRMAEVRRMRWTGHEARMVEEMNSLRISVRTPYEEMLLGRHVHRW